MSSSRFLKVKHVLYQEAASETLASSFLHPSVILIQAFLEKPYREQPAFALLPTILSNLSGQECTEVRFDSMKPLMEEGFEGFIRVGDLMENCDNVPDERGVYFVLHTSTGRPKFLKRGTEGRFRGRDPNVRAETLNDKWVDGTIVVNIGKTDGHLSKRVSDYIEFGKGNGNGHHGGRYIWQISNCEDLLLCWKRCGGEVDNSRKIECRYLLKFKIIYGMLPFANIIECLSSE